MNEARIAIICIVLAGILVVGGAAGWVGYQMGHSESDGDGDPAVEVEKAAPEDRSALVLKDEPDPFPQITDTEIEELIAETETAPPTPPGFDAEDMEVRRKRWESMSMEQRTMMRKSMFSALAKVDGLEEVGDAIREGKIDPRQFNLNPADIADRMEIHAELMDQEAMEAEVTRTLQNIVDQARAQLN